MTWTENAYHIRTPQRLRQVPDCRLSRPTRKREHKLVRIRIRTRTRGLGPQRKRGVVEDTDTMVPMMGILAME